MEEQALIIFIKNPVKGKVKTRLARVLGDDVALDVYQRLLAITRSATDKAHAHCFLFYSDFIPENDEWPEARYNKFLQKQVNDLGERMRAAFELVFSKGYNRAIIIGSDCPGISGELLNDAFTALDNNDAVIGPANDGGYYLLGMKVLLEELFTDIPWSTDMVLAETQQRLHNRQVRTQLLAELTDVDTMEDMVRAMPERVEYDDRSVSR